MNNRVSRNIVFALHEGDITETNTDAEWRNASASLGLLDGTVPYTLVPGNHDLCQVQATCGAPATRLYNQYFPPSRYAGTPTFGGVFEAGKLDNTYQLFTAGGTDWMIIGLEYSPRDAVLVWAGQLADSFPSRRIIVLTHTYLYTDGTLQGSNPNHVWLQFNNNGIDIWNKFIRKHRNISFVFNGHVVQGCPSACDPSVQWIGDSGSATIVSTGDFGNRVVQMLANYQEFGSKDTGIMRLLKIDPAAGSVTVETYSPWKNYNLTDIENQFQILNLDLGPPTSPVPRPPLAVAGPDRKVRAGDTISLDGSGTVDPDGRPLSVTWNFGDGTPPQIATIATHTYVTAGTYTATLTANDGLLTSVSTATVTVLGGTTLFVDDFKNGFGRWAVVNEGSNLSPSRWKIGLAGFVEQLNHTWGGDVGGGVNKPGTYAVAGDPAWTNYTFSVRFNAALGNTIGVMFRYKDSNNYYLYSQDASNAFDRRIVKRENGVNTLLASAGGGVNGNQWYQLQIQTNGTNIQVLRDGATIINVNDVSTTTLTSGRIALFSWANSAAYFDSVLVTGTAPPPPSAPNPPSNLSLSNPTTSSLQLSWTASTGPVVAGYRLDVATDALFSALVTGYQNKDVGNVTTTLLAGLASGTTYFARLRSYDGSANISNNSLSAQGATTAPVGTTGTSLIRVNCGGSGYIDPSGQLWSADTGFTGSGGGTLITGNPIAGTTTPPLYQSVRWGTISYQFAVLNGAYTVKLKFAELFLAGPGRVSNIFINGQLVDSNFDIYSAAGGMNIAVDRSYPVTVTGGQITIQVAIVNYGPILNAIEILSGGTGPAPPANPPVITGVQSSGVTSSSAAITWATDILSDSQVEYGSSAAYGLSTLLDSTLVTNHSVNLAGLAAGSLYHYRVKSKGSAAPLVNSGDFTLTTSTSPFPPPSGFAIRVNCGGSAYTDPQGNVWSADTGFIGGNSLSTNAPVSGAEQPPIVYQSVRWGAVSYQFAVPNGTYNVKLKFAELFLTTAGTRITQIVINGSVVDSGFDIIAAAGGPNIEVNRVYPITVTGGQIAIQLNDVKYGPILSGIEIQ